jgi:hypothetical protein
MQAQLSATCHYVYVLHGRILKDAREEFLCCKALTLTCGHIGSGNAAPPRGPAEACRNPAETAQPFQLGC